METLETEVGIPESEERRRTAILPHASSSNNEESRETIWKLHYSHVFKRGVTEVEYYGLKLAKNSSYPQNVVRRAMWLAKRITDSRKVTLTT